MKIATGKRRKKKARYSISELKVSLRALIIFIRRRALADSIVARLKAQELRYTIDQIEPRESRARASNIYIYILLYTMSLRRACEATPRVAHHELYYWSMRERERAPPARPRYTHILCNRSEWERRPLAGMDDCSCPRAATSSAAVI